METGECVVLVSGGLDSAVALWWAKSVFRGVWALTYEYGQKHSIEVQRAKELALRAGAKHVVLDVGCIFKGISSSLLRGGGDVPKVDYPERGTISTYVPMRNSVFGVVAAAFMESKGIRDLVLGVHSSDVPNYPDTRPEWASALESLLNSGSAMVFETSRRIRVHTPLIGLKKPDIIRMGLKLGVPFELTWSCYDPKGDRPCGECPSCRQRKKAFEEVGVQDPLEVESKEV